MKTIACTVIAAMAGLTAANPILSTSLADYTVDNAAMATVSITIDVSGYQFNDVQGSPLNQTLSIFVGVGAFITGLSWDVNLTSIGASWGSEAVMGFENQINLTVSADAYSVTNMNYNSGGIIDFTDAGVPNIYLTADGILDIELYETFVDNAGTGDNFFEAGSTITIVGFAYPTPGPLAVLGLGGLVATRRRR